MSSPVRFGILSTAAINRAFVAAVAECERASVVAVASRDAARAAAHAGELGIERAYGSYEELLADDDVEAVYISVPNSLHVEWSIRAFDAGKHVLCEKPLARTLADAAQAFDAAERAGRLLMEGLAFRHHQQTRRLQEFVAGGAVGELRLLRASLGFSLQDRADIRMRPELEGGAIMDIGCYCVSVLRLLAGEPTSVVAVEVVGDTGVDVRVAAALRFTGDVLAHFDVAMDVPRRRELEVVGSEGELFVADPWHPVDPAIELRRGGTAERIEIERESVFVPQVANFAAAVRGEARPLLGREDALGQARALEAIYNAAEAGMAVAV